ncbi:zinc transporter 10 [Sceloporus undulatus]|uniref:zinc transporter 10 n=1 Tax=Sceloporus undulatus TaxID=8520 RepID=UPI001C4D1DE4|nr:zinc transporter 10 [Sceloporus undulatus]
MGRFSGQTCRLLSLLALTGLFFVAELVSGYLGNSLALISDAFSMLSDLVALAVGLATGRAWARLRQRRRSRPGAAGPSSSSSSGSSFASGRGEVLGALGNAVFLAALYFTILVEALQRLAQPQGIRDAFLVLVVGALGLAVNLLALLLFQDFSRCCPRPPSQPQGKALATDPEAAPEQPSQEEAGADGSVSSLNAGDSLSTQKQSQEEVVQKKEKKSEALNIRGVLLHVMGDALGSVIVVIAASIFYALPLEEGAPCNWECYIDPSLTIIMVFIILSSAVPLIKETSTILLQMVPKSVNMQILTNKLLEVPGVSSIHEVHVWELVKGKNIATLHIKCHSTSDYEEASYKMREVFHEAGVHSVTIQPEYLDQKSPEILCSAPCISKACDPHLCCSQQETFLAQVNGYNGKGGLSPTLQKSFQKKDAGEIPDEPTWAEDAVIKNSSPKNGYKEASIPKPKKSSTRF